MHLNYHHWSLIHPLTGYTLYSDAYYMRLAFDLAAQGWFAARPNPMVGCVLVHNATHTIIGQGYHACYGQPHAEVNALLDWKQSTHANLPPHEVTAYITLEPCSHTGKTPPCCKALVEAGISHVVLACQDANPKVAGKGVAYLTAHGVEVTMLHEFEVAHQALNAPFLWGCTHQRPYVTIKVAQTLDAAIATRSGSSQWISYPQALTWVHTMRGGYDAILSTAETVLHDVAQLTVRSPQHSYATLGQPPNRIVVDRRFRFSAIVTDTALNHHPVLDTTLAPTTLCVDADVLVQHSDAQKHLEKMGVTFVAYDAFAPQSLESLMVLLYQQGVRACWIEAGAGLIAALRHQGLVNELYVLVGAKLLCDPESQRTAWLPGHPQEMITGDMNTAHSLTLQGVQPLGNDALLHYTLPDLP